MGFLAEFVSAVCFGAVLLMWSSASAPAPALISECPVTDTSSAPEAPIDTCDCEKMQFTIDRQRARIDRLQCDNAAWEYKIAKLQAAPKISQSCKSYDFRQHRIPFCGNCRELSRKLAASERRCESAFKANDNLRSENSDYYRFFGMHTAQLKEQEHALWMARFLPSQSFSAPPQIQANPVQYSTGPQHPPIQTEVYQKISAPILFPAITTSQMTSTAPNLLVPPPSKAPESTSTSPSIQPSQPKMAAATPPAASKSIQPAVQQPPKADAPSQTASAPPKIPAPQAPKPSGTPAAQKTLPDFDPNKISIKFPKKVPNVPTRLIINPPGTRSATAHNATPPSPSSAPANPHASSSTAAGPAASYGIGASGKPSAGKAMMDRLARLGLAVRE